jgi:hypothetical protein
MIKDLETLFEKSVSRPSQKLLIKSFLRGLGYFFSKKNSILLIYLDSW